MDWNRLQRKEKKTLFCSVFAPCPALYPNIQSPPTHFPRFVQFFCFVAYNKRSPFNGNERKKPTLS